MRKLMFAVEGQKLSKQGDFSGIMAGSKGYLRCHVQLRDNDWLYAKKVMVFNDEYAVALNADFECTVPDDVPSAIAAGLYETCQALDGALKFWSKTKPAKELTIAVVLLEPDIKQKG